MSASLTFKNGRYRCNICLYEAKRADWSSWDYCEGCGSKIDKSSNLKSISPSSRSSAMKTAKERMKRRTDMCKSWSIDSSKNEMEEKKILDNSPVHPRISMMSKIKNKSNSLDMLRRSSSPGNLRISPNSKVHKSRTNRSDSEESRNKTLDNSINKTSEHNKRSNKKNKLAKRHSFSPSPPKSRKQKVKRNSLSPSPSKSRQRKTSNSISPKSRNRNNITNKKIVPSNSTSNSSFQEKKKRVKQRRKFNSLQVSPKTSRNYNSSTLSPSELLRKSKSKQRQVLSPRWRRWRPIVLTLISLGFEEVYAKMVAQNIEDKPDMNTHARLEACFQYIQDNPPNEDAPAPPIWDSDIESSDSSNDDEDYDNNKKNKNINDNNKNINNNNINKNINHNNNNNNHNNNNVNNNNNNNVNVHKKLLSESLLDFSYENNHLLMEEDKSAVLWWPDQVSKPQDTLLVGNNMEGIDTKSFNFLIDMCFNKDEALEALELADGDTEAAYLWLSSQSRSDLTKLIKSEEELIKPNVPVSNNSISKQDHREHKKNKQSKLRKSKSATKSKSPASNNNNKHDNNKHDNNKHDNNKHDNNKHDNNKHDNNKHDNNNKNDGQNDNKNDGQNDNKHKNNDLKEHEHSVPSKIIRSKSADNDLYIEKTSKSMINESKTNGKNSPKYQKSKITDDKKKQKSPKRTKTLNMLNNETKTTTTGVKTSVKKSTSRIVRSKSMIDNSNMNQNRLSNKGSFTRLKLVDELIESERTYLTRLSILMHEYYKPFCNVLKRKELEVIFSNVDVIYKLNREFLKDLELSVESKQNFGDILVRYAPFFRIYVQYVNNFEIAIDSYHKIIQSSSSAKLRAITKQCTFRLQTYPIANQLPIERLLFLPCQRLPLYKLLLEKLKLSTKVETPDHALICVAVAQFTKILDSVNDALRNQEQTLYLVKLQQRFYASQISLLDSNRQLVYEGRVEIVNSNDFDTGKSSFKQVQAFLFSDMFVLANKTVLGMYNVVDQLSLDSDFRAASVNNSDISLTIGASNKDKSKQRKRHCFMIQRGKSNWIIRAQHHRDKKEWMKHIKESIEKREAARDLQNCSVCRKQCNLLDRRVCSKCYELAHVSCTNIYNEERICINCK